jgi:hygromycin-B 7''-O-kinase
MALPDPLEQFTQPSYYAAHFMDSQVWQPYVQHVCNKHGFTVRHIQPGLPGTYPTYIATVNAPDISQGVPNLVVKFFGPLFDGAVAFNIEKAVANTLAQHRLPFHIPEILAQGQLIKGWNYLSFEHIPGVSFSQARKQLSTRVLMKLAAQLGSYLRELHDSTTNFQLVDARLGSPIEREEFPDFIANQHRHCSANHQKWNDLPGHLAEQLPAYLIPLEELVDLGTPPHLIHADLTADHVLGKLVGAEWHTLAIIDWGDARLGNILYDLVALHLDLFKGDVRLLQACLEAYRLPEFYQHEFPHKAFCMVLLHQFPTPASVYAPYQQATSLSELAECLFGILVYRKLAPSITVLKRRFWLSIILLNLYELTPLYLPEAFHSLSRGEIRLFAIGLIIHCL